MMTVLLNIQKLFIIFTTQLTNGKLFEMLSVYKIAEECSKITNLEAMCDGQ